MTPVEELLVRLNAFGFWRVQVENSPRGRRYSCQIRTNHHVFEAAAAGPEAAIRKAIQKVEAGWRRGQGHMPGLKLAE